MSDTQISANKLNVESSTDPVAAAPQGAPTHVSFRRKITSTAVTMLPGENFQDFLDLGNGLRAEHKPVTITEDALVDKMVQSLWFGARAAKLQQELLRSSPTPDKTRLDLYLRYQTMNERAFSLSLSHLIELRKDARQQKIGFVLQKRKQELHQARVQNLNTRTRAQEVRNSRYAAAGSTGQTGAGQPQ